MKRVIDAAVNARAVQVVEECSNAWRKLRQDKKAKMNVNDTISSLNSSHSGSGRGSAARKQSSKSDKSNTSSSKALRSCKKSLKLG